VLLLLKGTLSLTPLLN